MEGCHYTLGSSFVTYQLIAERTAILCLNPLRVENNLNCVRFIPYSAVNTLCVGFENETFNFVHRNIRSLL
jgi:hypothetical protein